MIQNLQFSALTISLLGIFLLLFVATLVAQFLLKKSPHNHTFQKVQVIVKSWWYIATPILITFFFGNQALLILFFLVTCYGLIEIVTHSQLFSVIRKPLIILFSLSTAMQYLTIYLGWKIFFFSLIPILFIWIIPTLIIFRAEIKNLPQLVALVMGSLLVSYYLSHIPALPLLMKNLWEQPEQPLMAILILIFTTELNDILQFMAGKAFGRRKLFPEVSPNKTEAGFIGGLLGTTLLYALLGPQFLGLSLQQSLMIGPLISITGIFGDLLFSSLKRYYGVKDFSDLIPGHGGIMDRLDSLTLTAPLFFHLIFYFKGGTL